MKRFAAIVLMTTLPIAHGETADNEDALAQLNQAETTWKQSALVNYDYTMLSGGVFGGAIHKVSVRGEVCSSKWRSNRRTLFELWKHETCDGHKIEDVHSELRRLLELGPERFEVQFNAKYGYVENLSITPGGGIPDQDWYVEMHHFVQR